MSASCGATFHSSTASRIVIFVKLKRMHWERSQFMMCPYFACAWYGDLVHSCAALPIVSFVAVNVTFNFHFFNVFTSKADAESKHSIISTTLDTFQSSIGWLNEDAPLNILLIIVVTLPVFQLPIGSLNDVDPSNKLLISVTEITSHTHM